MILNYIIYNNMYYNIKTEDLINTHHTYNLLLILFNIINSSKLQPTLHVLCMHLDV